METSNLKDICSQFSYKKNDKLRNLYLVEANSKKALGSKMERKPFDPIRQHYLRNYDLLIVIVKCGTEKIMSPPWYMLIQGTTSVHLMTTYFH